ncbi:hypothetical protein E2C01_079831 [Portunus trituberculatus]|uniref:Uncharacterized protein n=1 Tax=Portunus trituberculatus TaxID=210409 RepID=A0A5B7IRV2_PORTR|nr:hypothetical protein [Portunus trituberculatus]
MRLDVGKRRMRKDVTRRDLAWRSGFGASFGLREGAERPSKGRKQPNHPPLNKQELMNASRED